MGEIKEARAAMKLAFNIYPELINKYSCDLPEGYNYRELIGSLMPEDILTLFNNFISSVGASS